MRKCRYCGRMLTDPASVAAGAGPVCREKCEGRYYQEKLFEPSENTPTMKSPLSKKYTAVDLLPRLGETVEVWHTKWECDMTEAVLVAIVKDGLMLGSPHAIDRNDEWSPLSIDEFNEKCRFKDHE